LAKRLLRSVKLKKRLSPPPTPSPLPTNARLTRANGVRQRLLELKRNRLEALKLRELA
jgi:hypothetical protein